LIGKLKYKIFIIPVNFDEKEEFISSNSILQLFPEANIKTAVEAKGIDYEQVVIFGFGDYSRNIESLEEYEKRFFYNKLYVAVTRAQLELIILDSKDSEINFWKKLIDFYADSNWSEASEVDKENICETIVYGGNQIPQIIQSTPEMALLNASKDQQQGIFTKNPFLLRIAANQFLKLGNKKEHFKCLAIMHKLKSEWSEAAKFFLKIEVGNEGIDEAAKVYWEGKLLREFINFQLKEDTEQNLVKSILAKLLLENSLEYRDYRILHEKRNKLRIVLFETPWNDDILEALLEIFTETSDRDNIKILIDIFEEICTQENRKVWKVVGDKNLLIKRFEYAIEAYERCSYEGINYIVAKIEIAKERDENLEEIFWLGAILVNNDSDNKFDKEQIRSKILQLYQKNKKELFSRSEQIPQVLLIIYGIFLHYGKEIIEVLTLCIHTETHYLAKGNRPYELIDFYWEILINTKNNSIIYQFLLNRWVRVLFLTNNDIGEINDKYRELCIHNKIKYHSFNESEIKSIPEKPSNILNEPPKHLKNVIISNFRQFNEVNIENLGLLNLVVGDNNVGKTTFLESLLFTTDKDELIRRWGVSFIERKNLYPLMSLNSDAAKYYYLLDNDFLEDFLNNKKKNEPIKYTINNKRSEWQYSIYVNSTDQPPHSISSIVLNHREDDSPIELNAYETVKTPFIPYGKGFGTDLAKVLFDEILSNKNEEKRFISSMKIFIPTIESVIADTANGAINIYDSNFPYSSIPLHQYGEGANKMFRILLFLVIHRGQRVLIDEIDSGIHFTRFRQFWHVVLSVAIKNNTQLVMTTHNEECIRYYSEALQDMDFEAQRKSRVVQLKKVNDELKVRSYEFQHFQQANQSNLE
jgi:AAA15 family ATPase/GTPase